MKKEFVISVQHRITAAPDFNGTFEIVVVKAKTAEAAMQKAKKNFKKTTGHWIVPVSIYKL